MMYKHFTATLGALTCLCCAHGMYRKAFDVLLCFANRDERQGLSFPPHTIAEQGKGCSVFESNVVTVK